MKNKIYAKPVRMTPEVMKSLEEQGLIYRLCPHHDDLDVGPGEGNFETIYASDPQYGPHKLITVTVDRPAFSTFGHHPDREEFWFIGDPTTKPLYLAIGKIPPEEFMKKSAAGTLTADDFIVLEAVNNNPEVSFFIMNANVLHGEAAADCEGQPSTFYVTESRDLPLHFVDWKDNELTIGK